MSSRPTIYALGTSHRLGEQYRGSRRGPLTPRRSARHSATAAHFRNISLWIWFTGRKPKKQPATVAREYVWEVEKQEDREATKAAIQAQQKPGAFSRALRGFTALFKKKSGREK